MAFTIDQYNLLNDAIAQGALSVKYADKEVTYRSFAEMNQIRTTMANELGLLKNSPRKYASYKSGL